jgi:DNA polymerase elongation subunit (family B)
MSDSLTKILFTDIETVSLKRGYADLTDAEKSLWADQCKQSYIERNYASPPEPSVAELSLLYRNRASIHSEFGRIIVIGVGFIVFDGNEPTLRVKTIYGDDEKSLLQQFNTISATFPTFCAHNGKKFDYPYLARRMLINGMKVPPVLDTRNKKPWEINHLDTQELWRFGDMVFPSLELMAYCLQVPLKKTIQGNEIGDVYFKGGIKRIADYCASDVVALANVYVKTQNPALTINKVQIV